MESGQRVNILLVDDRPDNLVSLEAVLEQPDYNIIKSSSGRLALQIAASVDLAVVLLDVYMPIMDGFETARRLREIERSRFTPIVFLTAQGRDDVISESYIAGGIDYIVQPLNPVVVRSKVAIFVELFRNRVALNEARNALEIKVIERTAQLEKLAETLSSEIDERLRVESSLRESEQRFKNMADTAPVLIWMSGPDKGCNYFNKQWLEFRGRSLQQESGSGWVEGVHADDRESCVNQYAIAFEKREPFQIEYRLQRHDGEYRHILDRGTPRFSSDSQFEGYIGSCIDITDLKNTESALRESEERYALATMGANDGIWDWNLKTNDVYFSKRWKSMLGYEESQSITLTDWFQLIHPDDLERLKASLFSHVQGQSNHFEIEYRIRSKNGSYIWALARGLAVRNEQGVAYRIAGSQTDIAKHKIVEEKLIHEAIHDPLTGIANRVLFQTALTRSIKRFNLKNGYSFAVAFMDIDNFKQVNDEHGHLIGDQLLIEVARRLESSLRPGDLICRFGGDEFAILLDRIQNREQASMVAERVCSELKRSFDMTPEKIQISCSVGITFCGNQYVTPEDVIRDADSAMYKAKEAGKSGYAFFEEAPRSIAP